MPLIIPDNKKDIPYIKKLKEFGVEIYLESEVPYGVNDKDIIDVFYANPMPTTNDARNSITRNQLYLLGMTDHFVRPDIFEIDVKTTATSGIIHLDDEQINAIKSKKYDTAIFAGTDADHINPRLLKNYDKYTELMDHMVANTSHTEFICWSSMVYLVHALGADHKVNVKDGQNYKMIGHFNHKASHPENHVLADAIQAMNTLPNGCVGYIDDNKLRELAQQGRILILSETEEKKEFGSNSSIAMIEIPDQNVLLLGPHPDYNLGSTSGEFNRDQDPDLKQPGVLVDHFVGADRMEPQHDWRPGAIMMHQAILDRVIREKQSHPSHDTTAAMASIEELLSLRAFELPQTRISDPTNPGIEIMFSG